jgi:PhoPQ-activated pathogenicity-related protein
VYWALRQYWGDHFLRNRIFPHEWQHRVWYIQPETLHNRRKAAKENRASFYSDNGSASLIFIGYA